MHKLMCRFVTTTKKKIPDPNLDTACPAGIPCNQPTNEMVTAMTSLVFGVTMPVTIKFNDSFQTLAYHVQGGIQNAYAEA